MMKALPESNPDPTTLFLLRQLIGHANPVFFLGKSESRESFTTILKALNPTGTGKLHAEPSRLEAAFRIGCRRCGLEPERYRYYLANVELPQHVFPVHEQSTDQGYVIPLAINPADTWQVSDAFGTFAESGRTDPTDNLLALLGQVEDAWERANGVILPVRWSCAYSLRLSCPVHFELFEGRSLQMPLLIALLRVLASSSARLLEDQELPLGPGPVFATGTVEPDGRFGWVQNLKAKLNGFLREMGAGRAAVLTSAQRRELTFSCPELLEQVQIIPADTLTELLGCAPIEKGLRTLCKRYDPLSNELLLNRMTHLAHRIEFREMHRLAIWALSNVKGPCHRFQFSCHAALQYFHQGRFLQGRQHLQLAIQLFDAHTDLFGVDDWARLLTVMGVLAIDAHDASTAAEITGRLEHYPLAYLSGQQRLRVLGTLCQLHRHFGNHEPSIEAGREAVSLADAIHAHDADRTRNYLAHALIDLHRENRNVSGHLLEEARHLVDTSQRIGSSRTNSTARLIHLGFCSHLHAEIARLADQPFEPGEPCWQGAWAHPWMFTLLSCARNPRNDPSLRRHCLDSLLEHSAEALQQHGQTSLFGLLHAVYQCYAAISRGEDSTSARQAVIDWCITLAAAGFSGWQQHLAAFLESEISPEGAEALCNAIRYN